MHSHEDAYPPRLSRAAYHVMGLLVERGGTMRTRPLLLTCGLPDDALADAINELVARHWASVVWRGPDACRPAALPERFRDARRVVATRFGRWRHQVTSPAF